MGSAGRRTVLIEVGVAVQRGPPIPLSPRAFECYFGMSQASGNEMPNAGFWPRVLFVPQRRTASTAPPLSLAMPVTSALASYGLLDYWLLAFIEFLA